MGFRAHSTFRIRCPGSIAQACIKWTLVSTWRVRRLAPFFTNPRAAELSVHSTNKHSRQAMAHFAPLVSRCDVLLRGRRVHGIPRVFNRTFDTRIVATVFDVSSPISIGHHHDRNLRNARNTRNIKIATNDISNLCLSKRLMLISSRVVAVPT